MFPEKLTYKLIDNGCIRFFICLIVMIVCNVALSILGTQAQFLYGTGICLLCVLVSYIVDLTIHVKISSKYHNHMHLQWNILGLVLWKESIDIDRFHICPKMERSIGMHVLVLQCQRSNTTMSSALGNKGWSNSCTYTISYTSFASASMYITEILTYIDMRKQQDGDREKLV